MPFLRLTMAERPTPVSIAVCALLALDADSTSPLHEIDEIKIDKYRQALLSSFLQACVLGVDRHNQHGHDGSLVSFMRRVNDAVGKQGASALFHCLQRCASSVDALVDLVLSLQSAIADGLIDGTSAHGIYVRKTCLGFDNLSFEAVTRLWQSFKNQVVECDSMSSTQQAARSKDGSDVDPWPLSPKQVDEMMRQQCINLEHSSHSYEETELEIRRILTHDPELTSAHFLRFLNCLRHGERVGALDALHQYFDYALIHERKSSIDTSPTEGKNIFQYAAILLAALHYSFGDIQLSLTATEEAVRVAQQSGDPACVAYALGWLYYSNHYQQQHNGGAIDAGELLRRCSSRATEGHLRPLVAGANLSLARHFLAENASSSPTAASCWTSLLDATTDPPPSSTTVAYDRPTHMTDVLSADEAMALIALQILVGAGIWESFGLNALSGLSSLVDLQCYSQSMSPQQVAAAVCNVARVAMCGPAPEHFDLKGDDDVEKPTKKGSGSSCRYAIALEILIRLYKNQKPVETTYSVALVLHEWAVRRGDLGHADFLSQVLHSSLHPRMSNYKAAYVETMAQHVFLLSRQGRWGQAKHLCRKLCETCQEQAGLRVQHANLLIQSALIHLDSSPSNFIGALSPLLECLSLTEKHAMDSHHTVAMSILAQVQFRMHNAMQAIAMLKGALPSLLQHTHIWFTGEAYLTLAKCHLQRAQQQVQANKRRPAVAGILRLAIANLEKSAQFFRECQDAIRLREAYYLQARTFHSIPGNEEKRNEASQRFVKVSRHLAKSYESWPRGSLVDMNYLQELASRPSVEE